MRRTIFLLTIIGGCVYQTAGQQPLSQGRIEPKRGIDLDTSVFPPTPKGYREAVDPTRTLKITPLQTTFNEGQISAVRHRAEADDRVKRALGARPGFLSASIADGEKSGTVPKEMIRLAYFNYQTNRAVNVFIAGDQVQSVQVKPKEYRPPESPEEVTAAEEIVRRDPRHRAVIDGLPVRGILTEAPAGRRYIYLLFKKRDQPATYDATVDMTAGKVVSARSINK